MLTLDQIKQQYPTQFHSQGRFLLREYFQHKLLELIFQEKEGQKLVFMGGAAIRLLHQSQRFSEDLDFDNRGLKQEEFEQLLKSVGEQLELEGVATELRFSHKEAFHCYFKLMDVLQSYGLTRQKREKMLVRIDTTSQDYDYQPEIKVLNAFDVFVKVPIVPLSLLMSQKLLALLNRKRAKGRDFFDVVFLAGKTEPDYQYLQQKMEIKNSADLRTQLLAKSQLLDMSKMADDVAPFLMKQKDRARVEDFTQFVEQWLDG